MTDSEIAYRPRRQLLVTVDDGSDTCQLRFFNFYPSQQKQLAVGARVRVRGELQRRLPRAADGASDRQGRPAASCRRR